MHSDEAGLAERVLRHIAEIGKGECSITDASIAAEGDTNAQEILAGLLMLHEDLQYSQERHSALLDELRGAIRVRDDFLSVASHELRTPITTLGLQIDGLFRMMQQQVPQTLQETLSRRLEVTRRQINRLAGLVGSLIDVSRITSGRLQLSKQLADLVEVLRLVLERFGDDALRGGSSLRFERQGPVWGNFDVSRVDQVFTNLLSNAIRYGRGKPIVVGAVGTGEDAALLGRGSRHRHSPRAPGPHLPAIRTGGAVDQLRGSRARPVDLAAAGGGDGGTISVRSQVDAGSMFTVEIPRNG